MDPLRHEGKVKNKRRKKLQNGREQWARQLKDNELQVKAKILQGQSLTLPHEQHRRLVQCPSGLLLLNPSLNLPGLVASVAGARREDSGDISPQSRAGYALTKG